VMFPTNTGDSLGTSLTGVAPAPIEIVRVDSVRPFLLLPPSLDPVPTVCSAHSPLGQYHQYPGMDPPRQHSVLASQGLYEPQ
jgi:hypothetical protein